MNSDTVWVKQLQTNESLSLRGVSGPMIAHHLPQVILIPCLMPFQFNDYL